MADALLHGKQYSQEEIMDINIKSKPGRGILSTLSRAHIKITSSNMWPSKTKPVELVSTRLFNARTSPAWRVEDGNGVVRVTKPVKGGGSSDYDFPTEEPFRLGWEDVKSFINDRSIDKLKIRVDWFNAKTETGHDTITIKRP